MNPPKMILFDVGRTLIDYGEFCTRKGVDSLMPYLVENPLGLTAEEIDKCTNEVFAQFDSVPKQHFEISECAILAAAQAKLGLRYSLTLAEQERILFRENVTKAKPPHAEEALCELERMGIRLAIVSNCIFSGECMSEMIHEQYPQNHFEFLLSSADFGIRKPERLLFDIAVQKSGCRPEKLWFVGDKLSVGVAGSANAGMTPVLYRSATNQYGELPPDLLTIQDFADLPALAGR